jgi:hypothetical protein
VQYKCVAIFVLHINYQYASSFSKLRCHDNNKLRPSQVNLTSASKTFAMFYCFFANTLNFSRACVWSFEIPCFCSALPIFLRLLKPVQFHRPWRCSEKSKHGQQNNLFLISLPVIHLHFSYHETQKPRLELFALLITKFDMAGREDKAVSNP